MSKRGKENTLALVLLVLALVSALLVVVDRVIHRLGWW